MTIENLSQVFKLPGEGSQVPPKVSIIMLPDGTFWEGVFSSGPLTSTPATVPLTGGAAAKILDANPSRQGVRILNWSSSPIYLGPSDPPAQGPPSEFIPPGSMDEDGNIWPSQFEFSYSPTGEVWAITPVTGDISLFIW